MLEARARSASTERPSPPISK